MARPSPLFAVEDLHANYGDAKVLQGVSMTVAGGSVVAVVGRNGVGKSTLIRTIMGFVRSTRGRILLMGEDITGYPSHHRSRLGISVVPQGRRVFPSLTVKEHLKIAYRATPDRDRWSIETLFELFPRLSERRSQRAESMSGGEQQMLAIARALASNPRLLLMDEPSEGLSHNIRQFLSQTLSSLRSDDVGILLVEQHLPSMLDNSDYVYVMSRGRFAHRSTPIELWNDEDIRRRYLGI